MYIYMGVCVCRGEEAVKHETKSVVKESPSRERERRQAGHMGAVGHVEKIQSAFFLL